MDAYVIYILDVCPWPVHVDHVYTNWNVIMTYTNAYYGVQIDDDLDIFDHDHELELAIGEIKYCSKDLTSMKISS